MSDYICPHNCAYRTNSGHCGMEGGHESCQYIKYLEKLEKEKTNTKPYAVKMTHADKIRAMSGRELAEWIETIVDCNRCPIRETCRGGNAVSRYSCMKNWLDWLREEADE